MVKVYHVGRPTFEVLDASLFPKGYTLVAGVLTDDLDAAYHYTQNIHDPWVQNPQVEVATPGGKRSTSVGDVFEKDGEFFVVAPVGFDPITPLASK